MNWIKKTTGTMLVLLLMYGQGLGEEKMGFSDEKAGLWMVLGVVSNDCGEGVQSRSFMNEFEIEPSDSDMLRQIKARVDENTFHIRVDGDSSSYWVPGTINDKRVSIDFRKPVWGNEYGFQGGLVGLTVSGTLTDDDRTVTGTAEWTWTKDNERNCSGAIQFKAAYLEQSNE